MIRRLSVAFLATVVLIATTLAVPAPRVLGSVGAQWSVTGTSRVDALISAGPDGTYASLTLSNRTSLADNLHLDAVTRIVLEALGLSGTYSQTAVWLKGNGPDLACITWVNLACQPDAVGGGRLVIPAAMRAALQARASAAGGEIPLDVRPDASSAAVDVALVAIGIYLGAIGINSAPADAVVKIALSLRSQALIALNALERGDLGAIRDSLWTLVNEAGMVLLEHAVEIGIGAVANAIPGVVAVKIGIAIAKAAVPLGAMIAALALDPVQSVRISYSRPTAVEASPPPTPAPTLSAGRGFSTTGAPLIKGADWLGGKGVDVFSNGSSAFDCALDGPPPGWEVDDCRKSVKVGGQPVYTGQKWQCVELAQRLWVTRRWWPSSFPVATAAALWSWSALPDVAAKLDRTANGKLKAAGLSPGDLVVWNSVAGALPYGHVAVIDRVAGPDVFVKEQNWGLDGQIGQAVYTLRDGWLNGHGYASTTTTSYIAGVIHHPRATATSLETEPKVDLVFVVDTTGSMRDYINGVKAAAASIVRDVLAKSDARIAVVNYRDYYSDCPDDGYAARVDLPFSKSKAKILAAINSLSLGNGCDRPESVYSGLMEAIALPWRDGAKKAVILMGDQPPHDPEPVTGYTADSVIAAAEAVDPANIYAVDINGGGSTLFSTVAKRTDGTYRAVGSPAEAVKQIVRNTAEIARAPVAVLTGPYLVTIGVPVTIDGSRSYAPDGRIARYEWDFDGDGNYDATTKTPTVSHVYKAKSSGLVGLRVTNNLTPTLAGTALVPLRVRAAAVPLPSLTPLPVASPTPLLTPPPATPAAAVTASPAAMRASPAPELAAEDIEALPVPASLIPGALTLLAFSLSSVVAIAVSRRRPTGRRRT